MDFIQEKHVEYSRRQVHQQSSNRNNMEMVFELDYEGMLTRPEIMTFHF